ncbi:MAG: anti-sigma factor [Acidobacteriota bacterium]|nr:anti-sigma factor [Acidobacteriota bacterium]
MEHLEELLATRATEGLAAAEGRELASLLRRYPKVDADGLDLAAAAAYLELAPAAELEEPLPAALRPRLVADGEARVRRSPAEPGAVSPFPAPASAAPRALGWWAAAACLLLAIAGWWPRLAPPPAPAAAPPPAAPTAAEMRAGLLREAADARITAWTATADDAAAGAEGDVVWSTARQQGYLRIRRLAANDPAVVQYQLWIFDAARDERYPVDGGVFDIPPGADEVVVPIDAKVLVNEPALFAVTVEPPGGVVVSSRERIVLLAHV